jgi:hypothetical protein
MFCPNCEAEYREGFTRCANCAAALVASLAPADSGAAQREKAWNERAALLWTGQDPVTFSVILNALNAADIPYKEWQSRDVTAALSRPLALGFYGIPHWEVRVHPDNLAAACTAVEEAMRPDHPYAVENLEEPNASETTGHNQLQKPNAGAKEPVQIWSGEESTQAEQFHSAFQENRIQSWTLNSSSGDTRIFVRAEDAPRAREIITREAGDAPPVLKRIG